MDTPRPANPAADTSDVPPWSGPKFVFVLEWLRNEADVSGAAHGAFRDSPKMAYYAISVWQYDDKVKQLKQDVRQYFINKYGENYFDPTRTVLVQGLMHLAKTSNEHAVRVRCFAEAAKIMGFVGKPNDDTALYSLSAAELIAGDVPPGRQNKGAVKKPSNG